MGNVEIEGSFCKGRGEERRGEEVYIQLGVFVFLGWFKSGSLFMQKNWDSSNEGKIDD